MYLPLILVVVFNFKYFGCLSANLLFSLQKEEGIFRMLRYCTVIFMIFFTVIRCLLHLCISWFSLYNALVYKRVDFGELVTMNITQQNTTQ